jgi:Flp pilus assembly protein TadG
LARWRRDRGGAMAVEFALIAPLLLLITVGIFETIFLLSDIQTASEATRRGARIALIEDPIVAYNTVAKSNTVTCTSSGSKVSCSSGTVSAEATFTDIVASMKEIAPWVTDQNVRVIYAKSGIDTDAKLLTPLITVELTNVTYQPKTTSSFDIDLKVSLPSFETSQLGTTVVVAN